MLAAVYRRAVVAVADAAGENLHDRKTGVVDMRSVAFDCIDFRPCVGSEPDVDAGSVHRA